MTVVMLRALGLGDFLTGVPAYRALRAAFPGHETVLAAPGVLAPLAALTDAVDRVLPAGELEPLDWTGPPPRVAVDLHGNGPASHRLLERLGAGQTMLYASAQAPDVTGPWWDPGEHETVRWCRLLRWYGVPADPADLGLAVPATAAPVPAGAVVVHPGAASLARRWPADRFARLVRALTGQGHRVHLTGAPAEHDLVHTVAAHAGLPADAVLETGLLDLAALVATARLVISGDTGISHLATAYATPSVTLFGPVSPALWGPPAGRPQHTVLWHGTGERPGDAHGTTTDPRLLQITVEEVLDAATALLRRSPDSSRTR
jgi:ADP-heptose:LPS heptosyltransferase